MTFRRHDRATATPRSGLTRVAPALASGDPFAARRRLLCAAVAVLAVGSPPSFAQRTGTPARIAWLTLAGGARGDLAVFSESLGKRGYAAAIEVLEVAPDGADAADVLAATRRGRFDLLVTVGLAGRYVQPLLDPGERMVFGFSGDPVEAGLVKSLARPGGNATGVSFLVRELVGKRMELLKEVKPDLQRVAVLANPGHPGERFEFSEAASAAARLGIEVVYLPVRTAGEFDGALARVGRAGAQGIDIFPDTLMVRHAGVIAEYGLRTRTPTISGWASLARAGNLLAYGANVIAAWTQVAGQVDRILNGAAPADVPVELATRVGLTVNLKTARAIGVAIPPAIIARADEVIE